VPPLLQSAALWGMSCPVYSNFLSLVCSVSWVGSAVLQTTSHEFYFQKMSFIFMFPLSLKKLFPLFSKECSILFPCCQDGHKHLSQLVALFSTRLHLHILMYLSTS